MKTIFKFLLLVIIHNVARYLVGGPIESVTIMEPMHQVMPAFPGCFDTDFTQSDFAISFFYNFMLWLSAAWIFFMAYPSVQGNFFIKSLKIYGVCCLFFISLAAVYMNHYVEGIRPFYLFSMLDAVMVFLIVALVNGGIFPYLFKREISRQSV